jgi:hypothetical protein
LSAFFFCLCIVIIGDIMQRFVTILKNTLITAALCCVVFLLIVNQSAKEGAKSGWLLCENTIIPSLLPILIITNIIIQTFCANVFEKIFGFIFSKVFKLPKCCAPAVILGLVGGYPAGAVLTHKLYENGKIDTQTARRIMSFNFGGGLAFTITAVGTVSMGSTKYGVVIYIINIISSLVICCVSAIFCKKSDYYDVAFEHKMSFADALVESVQSTSQTLINMSVYIILFSALMGIINIPDSLVPLFEITNGVCSAPTMPVEYCAFFMSFGGFCIHLQLLSTLRDMGIKYLDFLTFRIIASLLSLLLGKLYTCMFPQSVSVFSNVSTFSSQLSQVNVGLSIILVLGCAVIILDIENKKYKLI